MLYVYHSAYSLTHKCDQYERLSVIDNIQLCAFSMCPTLLLLMHRNDGTTNKNKMGNEWP